VGHHSLNRDPALGVLFQELIEQRVGNLVCYFVRVANAHALGCVNLHFGTSMVPAKKPN